MSALGHWLAVVLMLLPALAAVGVLLIRSVAAARWAALAVSLVLPLLAIGLVFDLKWQHVERYSYESSGAVQLLCTSQWVPLFRLALDPLNYLAIVLTTIVGVIACIAGWTVSRMPRQFYSLILLLLGCFIGAFLAFDLTLLVAVIAFSVVPTIALITFWGKPGHRLRTAFNFLLYMLPGIGCLVGAALVLQFQGSSLDLVLLADAEKLRGPVLVALMTGLLIRLPTAPLHSGLGEVIEGCSPPVAMLLASLIPLSAGYGLIRLGVPVLAHSPVLQTWLGVAGGATTVYCSLCALAEVRFGRVVAYAATASLGIMLLGLSLNSTLALTGAAVLLLSQCLTNGAGAMIAGYMGNDSPKTDASPATGKFEVFARYFTAISIFWFAGLIFPGLFGQMLIVFAALQKANTGGPKPIAATAACYAAAGVILIAITLVAVAAVRSLRRLSETAESRKTPSPDLRATETAAVFALASLPLVLGLLQMPVCGALLQPLLDVIQKTQM